MKRAQNCEVAGSAKPLSGINPAVLLKVNRLMQGNLVKKVLRVVMNGEVYFSRQYSRMTRRNACTVLFASGEVGEIQFFVWEQVSGLVAAVFREIVHDEKRPFFFNDAGQHILRMKPLK